VKGKDGIIICVIGILMFISGIVLFVYQFPNLINIVEGVVIVIVGIPLFSLGQDLRKYEEVKK